MSSKTIKPDPKLEALRKEGLKPRVEYDLTQILQRTKTLHAGFLFYFKHQLLLQKLCRLLDGNYDTYNTPGWGNFGHHLGLQSEILRVIECSKLGNEGYTYYVLQHYTQKDDSTIHKVIQALINMKRFDVIHQTYTYFNDLVDDVLKTKSDNQDTVSLNHQNEDSGILISSMSTDAEEIQDNRIVINDEHVAMKGKIIRPDFIPTPALVLRELKEHVHQASISAYYQLPKVEKELMQNSESSQISRDGSEENKTNSQIYQQNIVQKYDCKAMLTFAADGTTCATHIAKMLRAKREDGLKIGVLILQEHEKLVTSNPELFISGSFPQVDYIIPIITEGYLKAAMDLTSPVHNEAMYIDCKYVRFIYTLMNKYYVRNGCLNKKIRCIIPDELTHLTHKTLMREPIFETWVKSSSVNSLADRMLRRCLRKSILSTGKSEGQQMVRMAAQSRLLNG